jgi:hypothetical protein
MQKNTRISQKSYTTRFSWASVKREKDMLTIRIRLKPLRLKTPPRNTIPPDCDFRLW